MLLWKTITCFIAAGSALAQRKPRYYWASWKTGIYSVDAESGTDLKKESEGLRVRCRSMQLHKAQCSIYVTQEEARGVASIGLNGTIISANFHQSNVFEQARLFLDEAHNFLYYIGEPMTIYRIHLSNPNGVEETLTISGASYSHGFTADTASNPPTFYFYNWQTGCILRQTWGENSAASCFFNTKHTSPYYGAPEHLLIDPVGRDLYFSLKGVLRRVSLEDTSDVQTLVDASGEYPGRADGGMKSFAFDEYFTEVYWSSGISQGYIHRAKFDGGQLIQTWKVPVGGGPEIFSGFVLNDATIQDCFPTTVTTSTLTSSTTTTTTVTTQIPETTAAMQTTPTPFRKCIDIPLATARKWSAQSCDGPDP